MPFKTTVRRASAVVAGGSIAVLVAAMGASSAPAHGQPSVSKAALEALLVQPGELQAPLRPGRMPKPLPEMFRALPKPSVSAVRLFEKPSGGPAGGVAVFMYRSASARQKAYWLELGGLGSPKRYWALGSSARVSPPTEMFPFIYIMFTRCNTLAYIWIGPPDEWDTKMPNKAAAFSYAKRLAARLRPVAC